MVMEHGLTITNDDYEKICAILQYASTLGAYEALDS